MAAAPVAEVQVAADLAPHLDGDAQERVHWWVAWGEPHGRRVVRQVVEAQDLAFADQQAEESRGLRAMTDVSGGVVVEAGVDELT